MYYNERIKEIRQQREVAQKEMAAVIGVQSQQQYSLYETGMNNDKYYEKAKEVEAIYKKKKRIYKLIGLGFIILSIIFFILTFKASKYNLWFLIGGFATLSIGGTAGPRERNLTRWYNHQISLIEKVQLEDELRSK